MAQERRCRTIIAAQRIHEAEEISAVGAGVDAPLQGVAGFRRQCKVRVRELDRWRGGDLAAGGHARQQLGDCQVAALRMHPKHVVESHQSQGGAKTRVRCGAVVVATGLGVANKPKQIEGIDLDR